MNLNIDLENELFLELLEKIGGNSATIVLNSDGICVFASSATKSVLNLQPENLHGNELLSLISFHTLEGQPVELIHHPVAKSLELDNFIQSTPFFFKLSSEPHGDTFALNTIQLSGNAIIGTNKASHVVVQIRKAKREVEVGEMKSLFLSFAAHQLKTPSSVVKGFLELMLRQGRAAYSDEQWHFLTSAFESNEQLIAVSKTLLNMARLDGGLIEPNILEFDPNRALQNKIASFSTLYQTKRVVINFNATDNSDGIILKSDEAFFIEIFGIILGNAIKHSPVGGSITVSCNLTSNECEVRVADQGPGISPEVRETLFKEEQQSEEQQNSHGLGLYMAKKYIALLGGTIGLAPVKNTDGTGSEFYFTVPNVLQ